MGDSQVDQLIEIIKVLGTPSKPDVEQMNPAYDMREYAKFPRIKTTPWKNVFYFVILVIANKGSASD